MEAKKVYYKTSRDGWCFTKCEKRYGRIISNTMVGSVTCQECPRYKGGKFHRLSKYIKFIKSYVLCLCEVDKKSI